MGYFNNLLHCSYSITQCSGWHLNFHIYVCIYKTNGVTSTCTQNKSHTTHLQKPSLISVCKNICNQYNIIHFIVHIYHINDINYVNQIVRSKSYLTCPYSDQYLWYLTFDNINKFINNKYMDAFGKHIHTKYKLLIWKL